MKYTFIYLALICSVPLFSQKKQRSFDHYNIDVQWSKEVNNNGKGELFGTGKEHFFLFHDDIVLFTRSLTFYCYNLQTLKLEYSVNFENHRIDDEKANLFKAYVVNDQMLVFFKTYDSSEDLEKIYAVIIKGEEDISDPILVQEVYKKSNLPSKVHIIRDTRNSHFLIYSNPHYDDDEDTVNYQFTILSEHFEVQGKYDIDFPLINEDYIQGNIMLGLHNHVYIAGYKPLSNKKILRGDDQNFCIYDVDLATESVTFKSLEFKDVFIPSITVFEDTLDAKIGISGLFGDLEEKRIQSGFLMEYDPKTKQISKRSELAFDDLTLKNISGDDDVETGAKFKMPFFVKEILYEENGNKLIVSEGYNFEQMAVKNGGSYTFIDYHRYGAIFLQYVNPQNEIIWQRAIPKFSLQSGHQYFTSYILFKQDNQFLFIYNDDDDGHEFWSGEDDDIDAMTIGSAVIVIATLSKEGDLEYNIAGDAKEDGYGFDPFMSIVSNDRKHALLVRRGTFSLTKMQLGQATVLNEGETMSDDDETGSKKGKKSKKSSKKKSRK